MLFFVVLTAQITNAVTVTIEADKQDFKVADNTALFNGNVKVSYGNIIISSPTAILTSNEKGEPEKAVFTEGASAIKSDKEANDNLTADSITLLLASNEMIAQGNVYSQIKKGTPASVTIKANQQEINNSTNKVRASGGVVIKYKGMTISGNEADLTMTKENKPVKAEIKGSARVIRDNSTIAAGIISFDLNTNNITASQGVNTITTLKGAGKVSMSSDFQQYDKINNLIIGSGHVKVIYQDYIATGPRATLYTSADDNLDKIIFTGRAQIKDSLRKVDADKITVSFDPKNFSAEGNVKTQFIQNNVPQSTSELKKNDTNKNTEVKKIEPKPPVEAKKEVKEPEITTPENETKDTLEE